MLTHSATRSADSKTSSQPDLPIEPENSLNPTRSTSDDEAALIRDAVGGSARAFEQIVRSHQHRVFSFIWQMTRQRQDAEDLTQQTFIKAYHHLAGFDPRRPLINWLLVIARRTALNHFRSAKKWEPVPPETASAEPSPARQAEDRDRSDSLWDRARTVLPPRQFEIMWLRFGEDLSTEETARIVGLTQVHVKVLVHRARQVLLKGGSEPARGIRSNRWRRDAPVAFRQRPGGRCSISCNYKKRQASHRRK